LVSFTLCLLYPQERHPYPLGRRPGAPRAGLIGLGKKFSYHNAFCISCVLYNHFSASPLVSVVAS
jgi:hypothetical protein